MEEKRQALKQFNFAIGIPPDTDPTGATVYLHVCDNLDKTSCMKFPTESIARDLRKDAEVLDLSYAGLGQKGSIALAEALKVNSTVTNLILVGNFITTSAALAIARAINTSHTVAALNLSVNLIGRAELLPTGIPEIKAGSVVNELLERGSSLTHLELRDNHLNDMDVALFTETLAENVQLQVLDLSYNKFGYLGAVELAKILSRNGDLRELNLEWNSLRTTGCIHLLQEGFLQNNTIKKFNMSCCGLDDSCAALVARVVGENAIEEIIIANNRIGPSGGEVLAKGLQATSALTTLVLDGNPLMDKGCTALLNAVLNGEARTMSLLSLQHCGCLTETVRRGTEGKCNATILISEGCSKAGQGPEI